MSTLAEKYAEYAKGKWHDKPNYQCPEHKHYWTISPWQLHDHLKGHKLPRKPKAKAKKEPSGKAPAQSKKKKGGSK